MQSKMAEAERRIEEARRTQAESLYLGDLGLSEFPASLGDLPHLQKLYLGRARPNEAGNLEWNSHLRELLGSQTSPAWRDSKDFRVSTWLDARA